MLLTARDDIEAMHEAFKEGVDDFLNKANLRGQLLPRVFAAQRIAERQNELLRTNKLLRRKVRELTTTDLVDPVTGLGNMKFTLERIGALSKEIEARGGAACVLLVGINNLDVIEKQYDKVVIDELMSGIGAKLRQLVRPLDVVTRPEANMFAVTMLQAGYRELHVDQLPADLRQSLYALLQDQRGLHSRRRRRESGRRRCEHDRAGSTNLHAHGV